MVCQGRGRIGRGLGPQPHRPDPRFRPRPRLSGRPADRPHRDRARDPLDPNGTHGRVPAGSRSTRHPAAQRDRGFGHRRDLARRSRRNGLLGVSIFPLGWQVPGHILPLMQDENYFLPVAMIVEVDHMRSGGVFQIAGPYIDRAATPDAGGQIAAGIPDFVGITIGASLLPSKPYCTNMYYMRSNRARRQSRACLKASGTVLRASRRPRRGSSA